MLSYPLKFAVLSFVGLLAVAAFGQTKPSVIPAKENAAQIEFFETKVRPLLVSQCVSCHGAAQQLGGLRLDTRAGLLQGGTRGAVVIAGKPDQSLLLQAVHYADAKLKMPPAGKLSDDKIKILEQWIQQGAFFRKPPAKNWYPKRSGHSARSKSRHCPK